MTLLSFAILHLLTMVCAMQTKSKGLKEVRHMASRSDVAKSAPLSERQALSFLGAKRSQIKSLFALACAAPLMQKEMKFDFFFYAPCTVCAI